MAKAKGKLRGKRRGTRAELEERKRRQRARAKKAKAKKKTPARMSKPSGGGTQRSRGRRGLEHHEPRIPEFPAAVKARAPQVHAGKKKKRKELSKTPEAKRARAYRAEKRALAEAAEARRLEKNARARARRRQKLEEERAKAEARRPVTERDIAIEWLEVIRDHSAHVSPTTLSIVTPEAASTGAWLVCGRFDLLEPIGYADMGEILERLLADDILAARINPARLSQIRIIYNDPNARRGESDSIVSKIAGWEFALGDLIGEILGGGTDNADALAVRYEHTQIETYYAYFAPTVIEYRTVWPGATTMTVPISYQKRNADDGE